MSRGIRIITELPWLKNKIVLVTGGYHSYITIVVVDDEGNRKFIKIVGGSRYNFDKASATKLACDLWTYYDLLDQRGLLLPKPFEVCLMRDKARRCWEIVIIEAYTGIGVNELIKTSSPDVVQSIVKAIVRYLEPLFSDTNKKGDLIVGIDVKPDNFTCIICNGKIYLIYFVDVMPPHFRKESGPLIEIPVPRTDMGRKIGYFRSYDKRGILLVLQTQLSRLRPDLRPLFKSIIMEFAESQGIADFFKKAIWETFAHSSPKRKRQIIESLTAKDMYCFREIACEIFSANPKLQQPDLDQSFRVSHFDDGLTTATVLLLKSLLIQMAGLQAT